MKSTLLLLLPLLALPCRGQEDLPRVIRSFTVPGHPNDAQAIAEIGRRILPVEVYALSSLVIVVGQSIPAVEEAVTQLSAIARTMPPNPAWAGDLAASGPVVETVVPYLGAARSDIENALSVFREAQGPGQARQPAPVRSFSILAESRQVVLRGIPEDVARMKAVVEAIVQAPKPASSNTRTYTLRLRLLLAAESDGPGEIRGPLADRLRGLLPYGHFREQASALISVCPPNQGIAITLESRDGAKGDLELSGLEIGPDGTSLSVNHLKFRLLVPAGGEGTGEPARDRSALQLGTRIVAREAEDLVVGALGRVPYLLVLNYTR
jgi:hypothetical protein